MARVSVYAVVFFVALNAGAVAFQTTGVAADLGIDASVDDDQIGDAANEEDVPTGSGSGDTLFGLYNVLGGFLSDIFGVIFPGLALLNRAGVPVWMTNLVGTVFSVIITFDIASFIRGFNL